MEKKGEFKEVSFQNNQSRMDILEQLFNFSALVIPYNTLTHLLANHQGY